MIVVADRGRRRSLAWIALGVGCVVSLASAAPRSALPPQTHQTAVESAVLKDFQWRADGEDQVAFTFEFDRDTPLVTRSALDDKHYFHLDFHHVAAPTAPETLQLSLGPIRCVRRIYYTEHSVLRFVFYAKSDDLLFEVHTTRDAHTRRLSVKAFERAAALPSPPGSSEVSTPRPAARPGRGGSSVKRIVIDPGHGVTRGVRRSTTGARTSCRIRGRHRYEKDMVLKIAQYLRGFIDRTAGLEAVMTREDDRYVSLSRRVEMAIESEGDLFLSLHMNAARRRSPTARGFEIFYLSDGTKETNRQLVALENEYVTDYGATDIHGLAQYDELRAILRDLADDVFRQRQAESRLLCEEIDAQVRHYKPLGGRYHRGVKSAAFRVLMNYQMPSVLAECGFLDHPADARVMASKDGQQFMAALLFNGINRYFARTDPTFKPHTVRIATTRRGGHTFRLVEASRP